MFLWNYNDIKSAWSFASWSNIKRLARPATWNYRFWRTETEDTRSIENEADLDPHYRLMLVYKDAPNWWYGLILVSSIVVGLVCIYQVDSTLPWWAFLIAIALSSICILFFG